MDSSPDGIATILYLEGEALAGTRSSYLPGYAAPSGSRHSCYWPNTAMFCPVCGQIWGRVIYEFHFTYKPLVHSPWISEARRCPQHGDGLFLSGYGPDQFPYCSRELLKREALLLCLSNPPFKDFP